MELEAFKSNFPQVWENIERDSFLSESKKKEFVNHLKVVHDVTDIDGIKKFFHNNKLKGKLVSFPHGSDFGRLVTKEDFQLHLSNNTTASISDVISSIEETMGLPEDAQLADFLDQYSKIFIGPYMIWSFSLKKEYSSILDAFKDPFLVCRLGLDQNAEYFCLHYTTPDGIKIKEPTAFDAGLNDKWRPGSRTQPLNDCRSTYSEGLTESVHESFPFSYLISRIQEHPV